VSDQEFRIVAAGDAALVVEFAHRVDPDINARLILMSDELRRRAGTAVRDVVVGYVTLTVYFDPLHVDMAWLDGEIRDIARRVPADLPEPGRLIDVPVCYGGELGPDLGEVSNTCGCSEADVVELHTSVEYRVFVVGFVPGFAYMGVVNERLALPRRATPRTKVPPGSVAIAAGQTGIYPIETPGGWHILGRTPLRPFDPRRAEPALFTPGDRVRFHVIDRETFERMAEA
jgi:inhibitor of KinA